MTTLSENKESMLTLDRLKATISYEKDSGEIRWVSGPRAGRLAGTINQDGYLVIEIDRKKFRAHRLCWFYVHGKWPKQTIDHIDRNKLNNKLSNLREASTAENNQNTGDRKDKSRVSRGVYRTPSNKFSAYISLHGKMRYLGIFDDSNDAATAYLDARKRLHPGFVDNNPSKDRTISKLLLPNEPHCGKKPIIDPE